MIIDTSAIMAILLREPDAARFGAALSETAGTTMSAATLVELTMVAEGRAGAPVRPVLDALLMESDIEVVPFTAEHAALAADGWRRFGRGRHPAALNLGDCFAYALSKARDEPLLFKGEDFAQTDVKAAL
ncbi:type II toxin-antitoxin system VapC family toxin [Plastoroseomonas hellenica]|uniref:type II toxin-antitoxin system VapC family toxin n=1 Tax=Plastoroseomonas hellenica TaxID=2687306 RepID=UPI001BAE4700|nr:type II toxin-antitoxin system VapC family toxin [Plastoroseomonas hellenica]